MKAKSIFIPLLFLMFGCTSIKTSTTENTEKLSTIDFVQILNNNKEEAIFYYQKNWKVLREMALEKGYIDSFELFEMDADKDSSFEIMLITTYSSKQQYEKREEHFAEIMKLKGGLELLNDKKPNEFRKTLFSKNSVTHF
ncbi:hypothetical protein WAF17_11835 [Bernardetia sp. ABR2-2B]|uniref:hypothetical protein n=1 Tax=Bernardetia sp. ABR2-2B TaxID=3127472 RepID=UPI0030CFB5E2